MMCLQWPAELMLSNGGNGGHTVTQIRIGMHLQHHCYGILNFNGDPYY